MLPKSTIIAGCLTQATPPHFYLAVLNPDLPGGSGINFIPFCATLASADRALERFKADRRSLSDRELEKLELARQALHRSELLPAGNPNDIAALDNELADLPYYKHGDLNEEKNGVAPFLAATDQAGWDAVANDLLTVMDEMQASAAFADHSEF